ncbi:MAG: von Willebrand factor type A domain-containing protein [Rhodoferax sp.]|uniref:YfbK domain-containing protein n=1 Tax=Rhodoferax sp. TaxID=50421 RepID=UPI0027305DF0|nr:von Willebrand factor type A domain-containing protein [Rhodoferax sp.]MDP1528839.1 von Willebrand factor type A domain-containing protein [Rhodoferax sp.]
MKPEQITAWALEEASAEERQQLEAELHENPQAKQNAEETKQFCHFLLAELRDDSLALTEAQRERLKAQPVGQSSRLPGASVTPAPRTQWRTAMVRFALAACVVLGGFWTWHAYDSRKTVEVALEVEHRIQPGRRGTDMAPGNPVSEARIIEGKPIKAVDPLSGLVAGVKLEPVPSLAPSPEMPRMLMLNAGQSTMTPGDVEELKKIQDQQAYGLGLGNNSRSTVTNQSGLIAGAGGNSPMTVGFSTVGDLQSPAKTVDVTGSGGMNKTADGTLVLSNGSTFTGDKSVNAGNLTINGGTITTSAAGGSVAGASYANSGSGTVMLTGSTTASGGFVQSGSPTAAPANTLTLGGAVVLTTPASSPVVMTATPPPVLGKAFEQQNGVDLMTAPIVTTKAGTAATSAVTRDFVTPSPASPPVVMSPQPDAYYFAAVAGKDSDGLLREHLVKEETATVFRRQSGAEGESYTRIVENELKDVAREPLSTFSIDVDTAAYANVRRFLNQNMIPPPDAVRIEELVNYFPTAEEGPAPQAKEPFGVRVEMAPCPWQPTHRLARIAIKGRELGHERKNSNLVFLVDVSGSMNEPSKLPLVQQSLRMLTEQLGEGDRVTMVVYAGSSGLVLPPTNGEKKADILAAIEKLKAGGSTHGSAGIQLAYEQAVAGFIKEGVNRVILCTDGDFNVGVSSPEELEKLITKKAKSGVFLSVLGFGSGNLKDRTMETLADKGNGNYAYIDSLSEARKVLVEQMSGTLVTIAKDVKIQVEFNPAAVRSYRLIGYENRLLAKEDFNDDTKDAGEIGAGHSVVALYEVVPANLPPGAEPRPAVDSLKYQTPAIAPAQLADAAQSGELMTVKLRYKEPDSDLSKLIEMPVKDEGKTLTASSEEYKFSAAVAGFGLLLRDSAYKGTLSWETVRKLALDGKGADKLGYRGEFLQLIDKARGLKETRP